MKLRKITVAAAATITAMTLAACAGGTSADIDDHGVGAGGGEAAEAPAGAVADLTIAVSEGPLNVESNNPWVASSARQFGYVFVTMEPLAILNPLDPSELTPWLAESWEWNDTFTELSITARDGVLWSDGEPFTAQDIAFTFQLIADTEGIPASNRPIDIQVDGNTVTVIYERTSVMSPHSPLQTLMVPEHFVSQVEGDVTEATLLGMPGTGPFVKTQFTPQAVTLEARTDWWGGEIAVPRIHFVSYNDNTSMATALAAGQVDWTQGALPNVQDFLKADPANVVWTPTALDTDVLFVNHTRAPFDSLAFRQAVNMVIDRDAHQQIVLEGNAPVLESVTGQTPGAGRHFIAPEFEGVNFEVDLEGAKALLEEAGYTGVGETLIDPQGNPVSLSVSVPADWHDFVTAAQLVVNSIQRLGADATLNTMDGATWWTNRGEGDFDAVVNALAPEAVTPFAMYQQTMGTEVSAPIGENAGWNFGRFFNAEADAAIETYLTSPDVAARDQAVVDLQRIFVEEVPVMPLGVRPLRSAFHTRTFTGWPTDENPYAPMQTLQPSMLLVVTNLQPVA